MNNSYALDEVCRLAKDGRDYKDMLRDALNDKNTMVLDLYTAMQAIVDTEQNKTKCTICCEDIGDHNTSWKLPCGHSFHIGCISKHFAKSGACTCPNCRMSCLSKDGESDHDEEDDNDGEDDEDSMSVSISDEDHDAMINHLVVKLKTKLFMRGYVQNPNGGQARYCITKDSQSATFFKCMLDEFGVPERRANFETIKNDVDGSIKHTIVPNAVIYSLARLMLSVTESDDEENTFGNNDDEPADWEYDEYDELFHNDQISDWEQQNTLNDNCEQTAADDEIGNDIVY